MKAKITPVSSFIITAIYYGKPTTKLVRNAKQAAMFYSEVRTNEWYHKSDGEIEDWDYYRDKLCRRSLKVFQKYLPPGK